MKHKKMMERVLSLILCLVLLFPDIPARAEGETEGDSGEWEDTSSEEGTEPLGVPLPEQEELSETGEPAAAQDYGLKDPRLIHEWWSNIFEYDTIWFGSYVQDDITGEQKNSIRWRVLDVSGNEALLVSDSILDLQPFHDVEDTAETMDAWWHNSTLRSWMNGYGASENLAGKDYSGEGDSFITKAFTPAEREAIIPDVQKGESGYSSVLEKRISEPDTLDKVGLLGQEDIDEHSYCLYYMYIGNSYLNMRQKASNYVMAQSRGLLRYWLREMYDRRYNETSTLEKTEEFGKGYYLSDDDSYQNYYIENVFYKNEAHGVVARIRLDLSKTDLWSFAGTTTSEGLDDLSDAAPMPVRVDYSRQVLPATEGLKLSDDKKTALSYEGESLVVVIPEGVEELNPDFYLNSREIGYLHLPSTLKSIPDKCFSHEKLGTGDKEKKGDLTYVRFNNPSVSQLRTIGEYAFYDEALFEVLLPEGLEEIGAHAFEESFRDGIGFGGNHTNMCFPDSLKLIGESAFQFAQIQYYHFGSGLERLGYRAFYASNIVTADLSACKKLKTIPDECFCCVALKEDLLNVVLNEGLEEIGARAFAWAGNDSKPITIVVPDSVKSIGDEAFADGTIEKLTLPETVDHFGEHVISLAGSLHYLRLPKNLTKIDRIFRKIQYEDSIPRILVCEGDVSEVIWGGAAENQYIPKYIIYGKPGTALEQAARENGLTFYDCTKNPPPQDYEIRITERDLNVVADGDALCSYDENTLMLLGKGTYKISMKDGVSSTTDCIVIRSDCTVELDNVNIQTDANMDYGFPDWTYGGFAGIWIPTNSGAKVTIRFKGTNTIKGSGMLLGIMKYSRNSAGQLTLEAASGTDADVLICNGIGYDDLSGNRPRDEYGNLYYHSHNITIGSGTVKSSFGNCGCSNFQINGGVLETDTIGNLKVNGGTVKASNGVEHFSTVRINDGDVSVSTIESESKIQMYGGRLNIQNYRRMDGELEYHGGFVFSGEEQIYPNEETVYPESVVISKSELSLSVNETFQLEAHVLPENATNKEIRWSSGNGNIVTVDETGLVTGVSEGTMTIYASSLHDSSKRAECRVTVTGSGTPAPAPEPIPEPSEPIRGGGGPTDSQPALSAEKLQKITLVKGQKFVMADKGWKSSDKTVVRVSKKNVTARKAGSAVLSFGEHRIDVTVVDAKLSREEKSIKLEAGSGVQLTLAGTAAGLNTIRLPGTSEDLGIRFIAANRNVVEVGNDGYVTAVSKGKTTVTAYINGVAFKYTIKVTETASVKERTLHLNVGQSKNIKLVGVKYPQWEITGDAIVTVSKKGKITAKREGETTLVFGDYKLNVLVDDPRFTENMKYKITYTLHPGEDIPLGACLIHGNVLYKSNKDHIVWADVVGHLYARGKGTAKVTGKVNGKTVTIIVKVK